MIVEEERDIIFDLEMELPALGNLYLLNPTVQTRAEFLILRHIREAERPGNTGRLVALAMPNTREG
jgi:hypothetical protein